MLRSIFLSLGGLALAATANLAQAPPAGSAPTEPLARLGSLHFRHGAEVTALAYSADGKLLASGGVDHLVHLWNARSGQRLATLRGHRGALTRIEFFPDHERLLTASLDGTVRLWSIEPVKEVKKLYAFTPRPDPFGRTAQTRTVFALARDGKTAVVAGPDRAVRVWDFARNEEVKRLSGHDDEVVAVAISPDGRFAASSAKGASVLVWDLAAGRKIHAELLNSFTNAHLGAAFSPDSKTLAIANFKSVRFLDLTSKKMQPAWQHSPEMPDICSGLMYSHHGHWLLTYAGFQHGIRAHGVQSKAPLRTLKVDLRQEPCWALAPDNKVVALAPKGGDIVLWDIANGKLLNPEGHVRPIEQLVFSRDGKTIFTSAGAEARAWDAVSGKALGRTLLESEGLALNAMAEGGAALLSAQRHAWQRLEWDGAATPRPDRTIEEGVGFYRGHVAVSSRGRWLAVACGHRQPEVVVWDVRTGKTHRTVPRVDGTSSPLFAADERFLGQLGGPTLHLYDFLADELKTLRVADGFRETIRCAAFSVDSRLAAVAVDADALARAWIPPNKPRAQARLICVELTTQQVRYSFPQFKASVEALALSPDGRHLAVAAEPDHTVHLLDMNTGAEVGRLAGHCGRVQRLVFSSQGDRLASASADTTALVWDVRFLAQDRKPVDRLAGGELEARWQALTLPGGPRVHEAVVRLSEHPGEVVPYFKARFKTLKAVDPRHLAQKIKDLDDDSFAVRERATLFLAQWIDAAAPHLTDVVARSRSPEAVVRARLILANHKPSPDHAWREFRAIEVLEKMAVPAARDLLRLLADEAPTSPRAREAQAALNRLRN